MTDIIIAGACRTPVGKFLGGLSTLPATELGGLAARAAIERAGVSPDVIDEVIFGQVLQAGSGQAPARQVALKAEIPTHVGALTINKVCGSGLKAVALACQAIRAGDAEVVLAGGTENMSMSPYLVPKARTGARLGHAELYDSMVGDGLWDAHNDFHMGETGELVADKYNITREEQDAFALQSHQRALAAQEAGAFDKELVPVEVPGRKGKVTTIDKDESPRSDSSMETLGKLRAAFRKGGTVTAGNAPGCNDGAAACLVMSAEAAEKYGVTPQAIIKDYATGGKDPEWVMMAPVDAVERLSKKTGMAPGDYDLVEINEAFSVAAIAVTRELGLDPEKVNVNGGAVALGHPIGCSGTRILVTLLHAMEARGAKTGLAALCLGGGNAVALSVERP